MTAVRRWALTAVSTWPRMIAVLYLAGLAFSTFLDEVMNAASWVVILGCCAMGVPLAFALPLPHDARARLDRMRREAPDA